jgi:hypothetical protein
MSEDDGAYKTPSRAAVFAANLVLAVFLAFGVAFGVTFLWASVRIVEAITAVGSR